MCLQFEYLWNWSAKVAIVIEVLDFKVIFSLVEAFTFGYLANFFCLLSL